MAEFHMPSLGADMESGVLVEWLKHVGDPVARGDIIAVVETQKGAIEIEVFQNGVVETLMAQPGDKVRVGATIAMIRAPGEAAAAALPRAAPRAAPTVAPSPARPVIAPARPTPPSGAVRASPAARRRATELGLDLSTVRASAADGTIALADVERAARTAPPAAPSAPAAAAEAPAAAVPPPTLVQTMRDVIGAAMARSKREIPHYYLSTTVDLEPALRWLEATNRERPVTERLLPGLLFLKAVALVLRKFPDFNGFWADGRYRPSPAVHVGVAIALKQGGLIAPAVHDMDQMALPALMAAFRDLVRRARAGGLRSSELSDPTITVTSLGEQSVDAVMPVIYPPQVAIVGFGMVVERPWVVAGAVVPRRLVTASLAADHRVTDGHQGARFLAAVAAQLQEPDKL